MCVREQALGSHVSMCTPEQPLLSHASLARVPFRTRFLASHVAFCIHIDTCFQKSSSRRVGGLQGRKEEGGRRKEEGGRLP